MKKRNPEKDQQQNIESRGNIFSNRICVVIQHQHRMSVKGKRVKDPSIDM